MTRVKICGITRLEDARAAVEAGADALGFVFIPETPRAVDAPHAATIIRSLPPFVTVVGVFADRPAEEVESIASFCRLTAVQLVGQEDPEYCLKLRYPVIKGIRLRTAADVAHASAYRSLSAILLDTFMEGHLGGTGAVFPWEWARGASRHGRIIVAGGLIPENVGDVVQNLQPYGVDVSSGVEVSPGRKDPDKVRRFIAEVRRADLSLSHA